LKEDVPRKQKIRFKPANTKKADITWAIKIIIITFVMSVVFNIFSTGIMNMVSIWVAVLILCLIILTGIVFDIVGVAVTTASEPPFHSMATKRVKYADSAIKLIKDKDKVSNFCNDVVGDICGIVSGSASAAVVAYIIKASPSLNSFLLSLVITAFVAALTVGGKAVGKTFAIRFSNHIVYTTAKAMAILTFWKN
jgi:CBS domain containing-hemolysin-like protein